LSAIECRNSTPNSRGSEINHFQIIFLCSVKNKLAVKWKEDRAGSNLIKVLGAYLGA
jgi:hypothetical protein